MKVLHFFKIHRLFNKRISIALLWTLLILIVAAIVNVVGIRITGDIEVWTQWINDHAYFFLIWRLALYAFVVVGWFWMRERVIAREASKNFIQAKSRFLRLEVSAISVFLILEMSYWIA